MASRLPTLFWESSSSESWVRIVLLGDTRVDESKLAKLILGSKTLKVERFGLCTLYKTEEPEREINVVDTPGWNPVSIEQTEENIKSEIVRSWSLCPPGPDVFLLVIPVKQEPSMCEISEAQKHMELLSERVWKHTIVLFDCKKEIKESVIREHIQNAKTILEKCKRFCVFQRGFSKISELFNEIEILTLLNNGEFFMPQIYSEKIQPGPEVFGEGKLRQRRGSKGMDLPNIKENDTEEKKETVCTANHGPLNDENIKIFTVILMGVIGALIGLVTGSEYGILGACVGLVSGIIVGGLLAVLIIYIFSYIYSYS